MNPDFQILIIVWMGIAVIIFLIMIIGRIHAPYGRHIRPGLGPTLSNKWGWFWMELPALIVLPVLALAGRAEKNEVDLILIALWILHYGYRALVFPFRLKTDSKRMPVVIMSGGLIFNVINGALIGYFIGFMDHRPMSLEAPHVIAGIVFFFTGMIINHWADNTLIELRRNGEGYHIPRGGLFEYISCPNHFGEIVEWTGYAILAWNLPAASFALWTFCNLVPRSLHHHKWYLEHFKDYPENRKAVFPGLF